MNHCEVGLGEQLVPAGEGVNHYEERGYTTMRRGKPQVGLGEELVPARRGYTTMRREYTTVRRG